MNTKKNLTVAALAVLLAVPAFGVANAHAANIPYSPSENSAYNKLSYNLSKFPSSLVWDPLHTGSKGADPYGQYVVGPYTFDIDNGQSIVNGHIIPPSEALNDLSQAESDNGNNRSTANTNGGSSSVVSSERGISGSANSNNAQSEYQNSKTNNGKLVQTGENDGASKAAALGATALTTSIGLTALSFAKKHKDNIKTAGLSTDNVSAGGNNKPHYFNKSSYDMIMSHTFANLSKDLK